MSASRCCLTLWVLCLYLNAVFVHGLDVKTENYLRHEKHVLEWIQHVPKDIIPYNKDKPVDVTHVVSVNRIVNVDMVRQVLEMSCWEMVSWVDKRLSWDEQDFIRVDDIMVPASMVWKPDVILYNRDGPLPDYTKNVDLKAHVFRNGTIMMLLPMEPKSFCQLPEVAKTGDHVTCFLNFGSWNYDLRYMNLVPGMNEAFLVFYEDFNRSWSLVSTNSTQTVHLNKGAYDFATVTYSIELQRK